MLKRKKLGRPERAAATLIEKKVLSQVHRFKEQKPECSAVVRGMECPASFYQAAMKDTSIPARTMVSTCPTTSWWSPGPGRITCPCADLVLLRYAHAYDKWSQLQHCWLGMLTRFQHSMMLRRVTPTPGIWAFALGPCSDSAVVVWPAHEIFLPDIGSAYYAPRLSEEPELWAVTAAADFEACTFQWRSPAYAASELPSCDKKKKLLPVRSSEVMPLLQLAARNAFWSLSLASLQSLGKYLGCDNGPDLLSMLLHLLEHILPEESEEARLALAGRRMVEFKKKNRSTENDMLEIDEAHEWLDKNDVTSLRRDGDARKSLHVEAKEFGHRFREKKKELRTKVVAPPPAKKAKKAGGKAAAAPPAKLTVPKTDKIPQAIAKTLSPPGSFVWVSRSPGAWNGKLPPFGAHTRGWTKHTERSALVLVLRAIWEDYSDLHGLALEECPVVGLFDEVLPGPKGEGLTAPVVPGAAASSSSGGPAAAS